MLIGAVFFGIMAGILLVFGAGMVKSSFVRSGKNAWTMLAVCAGAWFGIVLFTILPHLAEIASGGPVLVLAAVASGMVSGLVTSLFIRKHWAYFVYSERA